jgi:hypothetical protein
MVDHLRVMDNRMVLLNPKTAGREIIVEEEKTPNELSGAVNSPGR